MLVAIAEPFAYQDPALTTLYHLTLSAVDDINTKQWILTPNNITRNRKISQ